MRALFLMASFASLVPFEGSGEEVDGPKTLIIGSKGQSGAVGAGGYAVSGFKGGPVVGIHTKASGVSITSIVIHTTAKGCGTFSYTVEYDATAPDRFELEIGVSSGTGWKSDGYERLRVEVRRD